MLKSMSMQQEAEQQQLRAQINEKKLELERQVSLATGTLIHKHYSNQTLC